MHIGLILAYFITQLRFTSSEDASDSQTNKQLRCSYSSDCFPNFFCNYKYGKYSGFCENCQTITDCTALMFMPKKGTKDCCRVCKNADSQCFISASYVPNSIDSADSTADGSNSWDPDDEDNDQNLIEQGGTLKACRSDFSILKCSNMPDLSEDSKRMFATIGFTKCMRPFGVLIAAHFDMPKSKLILVGKILAEYLDQDQDGQMDNAFLKPYLEDYRRNYWIAMPIRQWLWTNVQLEKLARWKKARVIGQEILIPKWRLNNQQQYKKIMAEQIHYFLLKNYQLHYPEIFSIDDSKIWNQKDGNMASRLAKNQKRKQQQQGQERVNSVVSREFLALRCRCKEYKLFFQISMVYAGSEPKWKYKIVPDTREELENVFSREFLDIFSNPRYHQLKKPLKFSYNTCNNH